MSLTRLSENLALQTLPDGTTFCMVRVPATGSEGFRMGSTDDDPEAEAREKPAHPVVLPEYWIGEFMVTQEVWAAVLQGDDPSHSKGKRRPIERVSWEDIDQKLLPELLRLTKLPYRLPTEAEWEYAAKGGPFWEEQAFLYSGSDLLDQVGWYDKNSGGETHEVGLLLPNALGLYDMSGNVYEWCHDWYGAYDKKTQQNPKGPETGTYRVLRGGGYLYASQYCRIAYRNYRRPGYRYQALGCRLALQSVG